MPEFLDGIEQGGGGLTTVADVTVSGGAVTEFGDTVTLVDGGVYHFAATVSQNGAGSPNFGWLIDSDSAGTNYLQLDRFKCTLNSATASGFQSNNVWFGASIGSTSGAGVETSASLEVIVSGTKLECKWYGALLSVSVGTDGRSQHGRFIYDSGSLPTQIGVLSSLASGIANGSTIKGVRLY